MCFRDIALVKRKHLQIIEHLKITNQDNVWGGENAMVRLGNLDGRK